MSDDAVFAAIEGAVSDLHDSGVGDDGQDADTGADTTSVEAAETPDSTEAVAETKADTEPAAEGDKPAAEAKAEPSEEDDLKKLELELLEKTPTLGKGRIKVSRHQAVLTRTRRQAEAAQAAAVAEIQAKYDAVAKYEMPEWSERLQAIQIAETQPERFVKEVLLQTPEYQKVFDALVEAKLTERGAKPAEGGQAPAVAEMPKPDVINPDGSLGYSADGARALVAWELANAEKKFQGVLESKVSDLRKEITPLAEARRTEEQLRVAVERMKPILEDARTNWPGFKDHEPAIATEMRKPGNERMTIHDAYRKVVIPTFATDRAKLEAEITKRVLADLNRPKPRTGVAPGSVPAAVARDQNAPRDTEDVIRESLRRSAA